MGLNMYVYKTKIETTGVVNQRDGIRKENHLDIWHAIPDELKPYIYDNTDDEQLFYWRKHWDLHQYFTEIYRANGGMDWLTHLKSFEPLENELEAIWDEVFPDLDEMFENQQNEGLLIPCDDINAHNVRGGDDDLFFNGASLELTVTDIDALQQVIEADGLPDVEFPFWGEAERVKRRAEFKQIDRDFIAKARDALANNFFLYYEGHW